MAWAAAVDPAPEVIHIHLRSPSRNSYLGGQAWSTHLWKKLRFRVPSLRFLHLLNLPATTDQLLNAMCLTRWGSPRTSTSRCTPSLTRCIPPPCDMVCLQDLAAGSPPNHSFSPLTWHLANPRWWEDLGMAPFHPTIQPKVHIPDITHPTLYSTTSLQGFGDHHPRPPSFLGNPPLCTEPLPDPPPWGDGRFPCGPQDGWPLAAPPQLC